VENANFRVSKDKHRSFPFKLYSTNNQLILTGETYMDKDTCISAIGSVRNISPLAKTWKSNPNNRHQGSPKGGPFF
jgi:uncharacterized protein YegP (UPF0339 family)